MYIHLISLSTSERFNSVFLMAEDTSRQKLTKCNCHNYKLYKEKSFLLNLEMQSKNLQPCSSSSVGF